MVKWCSILTGYVTFFSSSNTAALYVPSWCPVLHIEILHVKCYSITQNIQSYASCDSWVGWVGPQHSIIMLQTKSKCYVFITWCYCSTIVHHYVTNEVSLLHFYHMVLLFHNNPSKCYKQSLFVTFLSQCYLSSVNVVFRHHFTACGSNLWAWPNA